MRLFSYHIFLLLVLSSSLPAFAQTRMEMRRKYKTETKGTAQDLSTFEIFAVRDGIFAAYKFDENEVTKQIILERAAADDEITQIDEMPYPLVKTIFEELVPTFQRGKFCGNFDFESGRNVYRTSMYEKVIIYLAIHNSTVDEQKATVGQVKIEFQSKRCPKYNYN